MKDHVTIMIWEQLAESMDHIIISILGCSLGFQSFGFQSSLGFPRISIISNHHNVMILRDQMKPLGLRWLQFYDS